MNIKALVVDDKPENAYLLQTLLAAKGFDVTTASNGLEALTKAHETPPDLVISDILMPVMDGFSLCRNFKKNERLRSILFVFYTATYTDPKDEEFALSLGADLFIVKPQDPDTLLRLIEKGLKEKRAPLVAREAPEETVYLETYNQTLVRKLEAKLQQLEQANKALAVKEFAIASAISGIALFEPDGKLIYANHSFATMWEYSWGELEGTKLSALIADAAEASRLLEAVQKDGSLIGEIKGLRKNGAEFSVQIAAHAVTEGGKPATCFMVSCIDITDQVRMRRELQRTQKMESLCLFAAGIAHDFNNLLTGMFNGLDLVKSFLAGDSPAQAHFDVVMSVFDRARDLTQRLLAFAKGGPSTTRKVKVADIVSEGCVLSLSGSQVRYAIQEADGCWAVEADPSQLSQVFNNIIINARQAMGDRGDLNVAIQNRILESEWVGTLPAGDYVVVHFQDSGPGIPEDIIPRVFDPFFTTKKEGSGLGLVTSYAIVKNYGGHIAASSRPGVGACFDVWLPALRSWEQVNRSAPDTEVAPGSGRILIMDDEPTILRLAEQILLRGGYEVSASSNGRDAIEAYRKAMEEKRPFDLVVLDLTVRGGMGGEETLAALKEMDPHAVVIASSGYSQESTLRRIKEHGFFGLLPKPYRAHELLSTVRAAINPSGS